MAQCPTPEKLRFKDKRDATERAFSDSNTYDVDMRIYRCPCGRYHLTTSHNRSQRGAIEKRREYRAKRQYRKERIALARIARAIGEEIERRESGETQEKQAS